MTEWEYGIWQTRADELHRSGMGENEARTWLAEWAEMGGNVGTFALVRRELRPWILAPLGAEGESRSSPPLSFEPPSSA